jgi:hypothetical protein
MMRQSPKPCARYRAGITPSSPRYGDYALGYPMRLVAAQETTKFLVGIKYRILVVRRWG